MTYLLIILAFLLVGIPAILTIHDGDRQRASADARRSYYNSRKS